MNLDKARHILRDAVADDVDQIGKTKVCSAIQAIVWHDGELVLDEALGRTHLETNYNPPSEPLRADTPMDIASLTKPLVTATLAMQAVDEGLARLDDRVADLYPAWSLGASSRGEATLLDLLNHSSGLPAWEKFYLSHPVDPSPTMAYTTRKALFRRIARTPLQSRPTGRHCYSDLGYILLAGILEGLYDAPLHEVAHDRIFRPLQMEHTRYVARLAGDEPITGAAATEKCARRERVVIGTVHDENTDIMGGVSGHAGVFSTAGDLLRFCRHIWEIDQGKLEYGGIISREVLRFCLSEEARGADGHHLGGWDTPSGQLSSAGRGFQAGNTVGHLGFTGTSFWIERDRGLIAILLTNRVYPTRDNELIKELRVKFHEAVLPPRG
ncbi:beta-lactamase family protein [Persicimonas caeni]|uniref:Beta-lactamase family protein n=1 Tax=Persicimonas caeni TaxID=2292766 RepID=A0A4Y6PM11_PERCE|nr:serine hydrolase domain-containing protein [Persicimonas caeni]QDG49253.1 beta-lactamase family protein [Persicimonas caeni]QED30474.1 beta-lactamase family protein [Persicimonas caeni]